MRAGIIILVFLIISNEAGCQGYNHVWLLGNQNLFTTAKARALIDSASFNLSSEFRKMPFKGTEASICDLNGNLLMSTNGVWIANANNDTMLNGSGLNPNAFTNSYPMGLLLDYADVFLPYPGDSSKIILFHHSATFDGFSYPAYEIYVSKIDMKLDNGLGGVFSKNDTILQDTLGWGLAACKHANGRDWWIVALKNGSDVVFKMLLTPNGIESITSQSLNVPFIYYGNSQPTFSLNGTKFGYVYGDGGSIVNFDVRIFDFDRCTGIFSNSHWIDLSDGSAGFGFAFSPSGKYAYASTSLHVFQIDADNLTVDTIASYDGFYSPYTFCCATTFWNMYLAANGKIYITTGNGTQHLHVINSPDSAGLACDIQQHGINLGVWHLRAVPNHPNYNLGSEVGSVCDSLTGVNEHLNEIKNFAIKPNPNNGNFSISYLLPQGKPGMFEIYDILGKQIYKIPLAHWSTLQQISSPKLSDGIYYAIIYSGYFWVSKKIAVFNE